MNNDTKIIIFTIVMTALVCGGVFVMFTMNIRINIANDRIDDMRAYFNTRVDSTNARIDDMRAYFNTRVDSTNARIDDMRAYFNARIDRTKAHLNTRINNANERINDTNARVNKLTVSTTAETRPHKPQPPPSAAVPGASGPSEQPIERSQLAP